MNWNNNCKPNCGCSNCCSLPVNGGYVNGVLTITVGNSAAVIPLTQDAVDSRTPVTESFTKTSGTFVITTDLPNPTLPIDVYRNGFLQDTDRYIRDNKIFTFVTPFGSATGSNSPETITIKYYK